MRRKICSLLSLLVLSLSKGPAVGMYSFKVPGIYTRSFFLPWLPLPIPPMPYGNQIFRYLIDELYGYRIDCIGSKLMLY